MKHETVRASQINDCPFCLDMHVKEATLHSERASKPRDGRA